jgi:RNase P/RNase MRP subunit POP5
MMAKHSLDIISCVKLSGTTRTCSKFNIRGNKKVDKNDLYD